MTKDERALLLTLAKWCLRLEGGVAENMGMADDPNLKKLRDMIERVSLAPPAGSET